MPFSRAGQLARYVPSARLSDPIGLVAENLRNSPHGVLPVLDRPTFGEGHDSERAARVIGLIDVRALSRASQSVGVAAGLRGSSPSSLNGFFGKSHPGELNGHNEAQSNVPSDVVPEERSLDFQKLTARDVMNPDVPFIPSVFSLENALMMLDRYDLPALPVLDEVNAYRGIVSRADLLSALAQNVRPPMVGGMATPLGVWLTDGVQSGGAPPLGLVLSGFTMALCYVLAQVALTVILWRLDPAWGAAALSGRLGLILDGTGGLNLGAFLAQSLLFLLILRSIPLAGIHAAEHQTVHALERGLPLEVEYVEKMPRAHPRCGTNLLALLGLVTIGFVHLPDYSSNWVLLVLILTFFGWRSLGTLLQEWFTTRPASRKQLESGIKAARELIEKYQAQPFARSASPLRLLNNGMLYSLVGGTIAMALFVWITNWIIALLLR